MEKSEFKQKVLYNSKGKLCGYTEWLDEIGDVIKTISMDCDITPTEEDWVEDAREVVNNGTLYFKDEMDQVLLNEATAAKLEELSNLYNTEMNSCVVDVPISTGNVIALSTAQETIQTLSLALVMCQNGLGYTWIDDNGTSYKIVEADDVLKMLSAINKHNTLATELWGKYKQEIAKCTTREALDKIKIDFHGVSDELTEG